MRVSGFSLNNGNFEERKRALQRKEANDAYKKNAIYTQAKKNPMLKILEDLLSGKTEKELFENDQILLNEGNENINATALNETNDDIVSSREESDMPSEKIPLSAVEVASDQEENVNRISSILFDQFNTSEWLTKTISTVNSTNPINKSFESLILDKTYTKAITSYTQQMQLAQNGFQLDQPKFSHIA